MKTITALARQFGLSRTTLLYYDRIGLLRPSYRTQADARLYSDEEETRLARIATYRQAGVPLAAIRAILEARPAKVNRTLEAQLTAIQREVDGLKAQQRLIVEMLKEAVLRGEGPARTKEQWVALLQACAFSPEDMRRWHREMEQTSPQAHARFLRRIGLPPAEAERVRAASRDHATAASALAQ